jgi:hypothetical protein
VSTSQIQNFIKLLIIDEIVAQAVPRIPSGDAQIVSMPNTQVFAPGYATPMQPGYTSAHQHHMQIKQAQAGRAYASQQPSRVFALFEVMTIKASLEFENEMSIREPAFVSLVKMKA